VPSVLWHVHSILGSEEWRKALKRLENSSARTASSDAFKAGDLKTLRCVWLVGSTSPKP